MSLPEILLAPERRPAVVADLAAVVDQEVAGKSGLGGMAVKQGYAAVRKVKPDIARVASQRLLPDFATALDPFWADFGGQGDFGAYLAGRGDEASEALLAVTDARIQDVRREAIRKVYSALRGKAGEHVKAALPRLGRVIQKHAEA